MSQNEETKHKYKDTPKSELNPKGGGRKKIDLDESQIQRLAEIHCNWKEIAYIMGVSVDTLKRNYTESVEMGKAMGKIQLRRAQWRNAVEKDNVTMQIWLGKNVLGQSDNPISDDSSQILPWND